MQPLYLVLTIPKLKTTKKCCYGWPTAGLEEKATYTCAVISVRPATCHPPPTQPAIAAGGHWTLDTVQWTALSREEPRYCTSPILRPTLVKAATARSISSGEWAALTCRSTVKAAYGSHFPSLATPTIILN